MVSNLEPTVAADVERVAGVDVVPSILEVVCRTTGMGFAAVARVTEDRWIACAVKDDIGFGLRPGGELDVRSTICDEIRASNQLVVIDNVAEDEHFCDHHTPRQYGFQSYISVPIHADGRFFGTLCAIDPQPRPLTSGGVVEMFRLFARMIGEHLDAKARLAASEQELSDERRLSELREQFIAILGHDLRNPLAAIQTGSRLLGASALPDRHGRVIAVIQNSAARMAGLINNLLDFARGKLGGGLPIDVQAVDTLGPTLDAVVAELRTAWSGREIESRLNLDGVVECDSARIAQLLSNLLANALTHGDDTRPVRVDGSIADGELEISVANAGAPIAADQQEKLFQPYSRASVQSGQEGLGLGLYIASEIARAHRGTLTVTSTVTETRFVFRMPTRRFGAPPGVARSSAGIGSYGT